MLIHKFFNIDICCDKALNKQNKTNVISIQSKLFIVFLNSCDLLLKRNCTFCFKYNYRPTYCEKYIKKMLLSCGR
jgi:hypothetical protein